MDENDPLAALGLLSDRSSRGIALALGGLISTEQLPVGFKMPTVRAMAKELQVSPTTISDAWRLLQSHGAIETDGRRGTFVRGPRQGAAAGRYWQVPVDPGTFSVDLSTGTPDPTLLPPLGPALRHVQLDVPVTSYLDAPVLPELEHVVRQSWPFEPELLTIVDGAQDGLDRLVQVVVNFGDVVLVNDPAFPPVLDMLEQAGARVIGVPLDEHGICPEALATALSHEPVALFLQPRAHNPTGISMTADRAAELAELLIEPDVLIVEDDHSGIVAGDPLASIGDHLPAKVVHIRSYSKSHGPDLRLAAIGGAAAPIDTVIRRRRVGPSWSSRLLQRLLLYMLTDETTSEIVAASEAEYARRRAEFVSALGNHEVHVGGSAGLNLWVPVVDQQIALVSLAANGIGAAPGAPFRVVSNDDHFIRASIGTVTKDIDDIAKTIATAAKAHPRR